MAMVLAFVLEPGEVGSHCVHWGRLDRRGCGLPGDGRRAHMGTAGQVEIFVVLDAARIALAVDEHAHGDTVEVIRAPDNHGTGGYAAAVDYADTALAVVGVDDDGVRGDTVEVVEALGSPDDGGEAVDVGIALADDICAHMDAAGQAEAVDPGHIPLGFGLCIRIHTVEAIEAANSLDATLIAPQCARRISALR